MKKIKYLSIISAFVLLFGTSPALAQDSGTLLPPPQDRIILNNDGSREGMVPNSRTTEGRESNMEKEDSSEEMNSKENEGSNENLDKETKGKIEQLKAQMEGIKQQIEMLRENAKQKMQTLKDKLVNEKDKVKAKIKEGILTGREQALERFDNTIHKLEEQKIKVERQVLKIESQGTTVPEEIKSLSVMAESKLNDARAKVVEINTLLAKSTNQLNKEDKAKLQTLTKDTQAIIKEAQKMLNDEVYKLRKLFNPNAQPVITPKPETKALPPTPVPDTKILPPTTNQ